MAAAALSMAAQSKLDLRSNAIVERARFAAEQAESGQVNTLGNGVLSTNQAVGSANTLRVIINLDDADRLAELEAAGATVTEVIGHYAIADVAVDRIADVEALDNVKSMTLPKRRRLLNDLGRGNNGMRVENVHSGEGLDRAYKGDGVVVGLFDMGLDPNHINFKNDDQSASRVKRVWCYTANDYTGATTTKSYTTDSAIKGFTTDSDQETHGTHVLGTITGAYTNNKYHGMAPHADIAIACGDATDDAILSGIKNIINYAKSQGKPAVINLSLGNNCGHHDGTDEFASALNDLAAEVPIVVAAGNEGDINIVARKALTSADTQMSTVLTPSYYITSENSRFQAYGYIEIIASTAQSFDLTIALVDVSSGSILAQLPITSSSMKYFGGTSSGVSPITSNSTFNSYYSTRSYIGGCKALCPDNNRYYAYIECDMMAKSASQKVYPVIIVKGKAGQTIEMFSDGYTEFSDKSLSGYTDGTTDGTISDMACGKNTIAVGAYATRNSYPYSGETLQDIVSYSSYGKLIDGRTLPHVCAPGQAIISSMSNFYRTGGQFDSSYDKIYSTVNAQTGRTEYWCHMGGTSMAAPGVAGTVALMLEADPDLSPEKVRQLLMTTARTDNYVNNGVKQAPYQWGAGKVDAHAALVRILEDRNTGVDFVTADSDSRLLIDGNGSGDFRIAVPGASSLAVSVYDIAGAQVANIATAADNAEISIANKAKGVYIICVTADGTTFTQKVIR